MATRTDFKIEGAKKMERVLKLLGPEVASKIGDQALRAGAKPIIAEAKRLVRKRTRALEESITVKIERRRKDEGERLALIGFKRPTSARAHLIEFGTRHARAFPFMRPAMDTKAGEALDEMGRVLARGIDREARKLAKS